MIYNTRGIVLRQLKYSETGAITKIYTELFGLQSYFINNVRSRKSKIKSNMLQPLTLLELGVYHKEKSGLQRIKYADVLNPAFGITSDVIKGSMAIFLAEVLDHSIKEQEANPKMFEFLMNAILELEALKGSCANFHLVFMMQLSKYLGFYPSSQNSAYDCIFDKREGIFVHIRPEHPDFIGLPLSNHIIHIKNHSFSEAKNLKLTASERSELLHHLINYYGLHLENFNKIKSQHVLEVVMD